MAFDGLQLRICKGCIGRNWNPIHFSIEFDRFKECPKCRSFRASQRTRHRDRILAYQRTYYSRNPSKYLSARRRWRKKNNLRPSSRILNSLRARVRKKILLIHGDKSGSTMLLVGCSLPELMNHLQSKFQHGMAWNNYGKWHIDHITPCSSFNMLDPREQKKCFHYTNLQPLWAKDNMRKRNRLQETNNV